MTGLLIENKSFSYSRGKNRFTLNIQQFNATPGEIIFLHGMSGCGKTTLLNLISGVIDSKVSLICRSSFKSICYVMHESTLLPWLSVRANIIIEERLRGKSCDTELFSLLCMEFGLAADIINVKIQNLSLGMRQRVEIAKSLCFEPDLILLDESLSGIDIITKRVVMTKIWEYTIRNKATVIATAHQINDIFRLAQRVYVIEKGLISDFIKINIPVSERIVMDPNQLNLLIGENFLSFQ